MKSLKSALAKVDFIRRLEACGARRIEAVSFVNERRVPQMAGAEEIMAALPPRAGVSRIGLVLNERGWERCVAAACDEANIVVCASDGFGIRNQGAPVAEQVATMVRIAERRAAEGGPRLSMTVSVAFGDPFDGEVSEDQVAALARDARCAGVVCSVREVADLKNFFGTDFGTFCPGIRPLGSAHGDQKRAATPREARDAGADYVVVGRPIVDDADPVGAARAILAELEA